MEYVNLEGAGVKVSRFCLGTMMYGNWGIGEAESQHVIHKALEAGINFIDTADIYGYGEGTSEEIVGRAIKGRREDVVLASKFKIRVGTGPSDEGAKSLLNVNVVSYQ